MSTVTCIVAIALNGVLGFVVGAVVGSKITAKLFVRLIEEHGKKLDATLSRKAQ